MANIVILTASSQCITTCTLIFWAQSFLAQVKCVAYCGNYVHLRDWTRGQATLRKRLTGRGGPGGHTFTHGRLSGSVWTVCMILILDTRIRPFDSTRPTRIGVFNIQACEGFGVGGRPKTRQKLKPGRGLESRGGRRSPAQCRFWWPLSLGFCLAGWRQTLPAIPGSRRWGRSL